MLFLHPFQIILIIIGWFGCYYIQLKLFVAEAVWVLFLHPFQINFYYYQAVWMLFLHPIKIFIRGYGCMDVVLASITNSFDYLYQTTLIVALHACIYMYCDVKCFSACRGGAACLCKVLALFIGPNNCEWVYCIYMSLT